MKSSYHHYNGYVVRKPAFSYDILFSIDSTTKDLDEIIAELIKEKFYIDAVYWSSAEVYSAICLYKQGLLRDDKKVKLFNTLKKYLIRGSSRSTPYGKMSGCNYINFDDNTKNSSYYKARIDIKLLEQIKFTIENDAIIKTHLRYALNNTLYMKGGYLRFLEQYWNQDRKHIKLSSVDCPNLIKSICEKLQGKILSLNEIKNTVPSDFDDNEVSEFVLALIESGMLISELELAPASPDPIADLLKVLESFRNQGVNEIEIFISILEKIQNTISYINSNSHSLPLKKISQIEQLLCEINITPNQIFHIDLKIANNADKMDKSLLKDLFDAIDFLRKIVPDNSDANKELQEFKRLYRLRFDQQEIPLMEALDNSSGIGFPAGKSIGNSYESQIFTFKNTTKNIEEKNDIVRTNWLSEKIEVATADYSVVKLTSKDLGEENKNLANIPYNFAVIGHQCKDQTFFLQNITNGSALSLLGRFAYLDTEIEDLCKDIANKEIENDLNIVFAEILFLPEGRVGNICRHPSFYEYEIPIISKSKLPAKNQIYVNDLLISIINDEIILKSKSLNKRIIPRLSHAHNFNSDPVGVYKFLSSLQYQKFPSLGLRFNYANNEKRFFPRIVYKNIILHRATWILSPINIKTILKAANPCAELLSFLKNRKVNRFVVLVEHDNELFLDLENESFQNLLVEELKTASSLIQLTEWLYDVGTGKNISQFVIPLKNTSCQNYQNFEPIQQNKNITRGFPPGGEWLYLKIYCSAFISDDLLVTLFGALNKEKTFISEYFFIRYTDYHLRVRMKFSNDLHLLETLQFLRQQLSLFEEEGTIWKTSIDTYEREIERYGAIYMEDTEQLFCYDSELILSLLSNENFCGDELNRVILAVLNIDNYLSIFNLTLREKILFCKKMEFEFEKEFDGQNKKYLYKKYRDFGTNLYSRYRENYMDEFFQIRTNKILKLNLSKERLCDYIHMSINRWFPSQQRFYEYLCYIFATKLYNRLLNEKDVQ